MRRTIAGLTLLAALAVGTTGCGLIGTGPSTDEEAGTHQEAGAPPEDDGAESETAGEGGAGEEDSADGAKNQDPAPSDGGGEAVANKGEAGTHGGADEDADGADPADGAGVLAMEETIAESSIDLDGSTLSFELKGVTANESTAVAHGILTNTGAHAMTLKTTLHDNSLIPEHVPRVGSNSQINALTLTDTATGNLHTPAYTSDGHCLCTERPHQLEPGESLRISAQYAPLPEDSASVTVTFGPLGSFDNVPVIRS